MNTTVCPKCGNRHLKNTDCQYCQQQAATKNTPAVQPIVVQLQPAAPKHSETGGMIVILLVVVLCALIIGGVTLWKDTRFGTMMTNFFKPLQAVVVSAQSDQALSAIPEYSVKDCGGETEEDNKRLTPYIVTFRNVTINGTDMTVPSFLNDDGTMSDNFPTFNGKEYLLVCFVPDQMEKWGRGDNGKNLDKFIANVQGTLVKGSLQERHFLFYKAAAQIPSATPFRPSSQVSVVQPTAAPEMITFIEPLPTPTPFPNPPIIAAPQQEYYVEWSQLMNKEGVGALVWQNAGTELFCETIRLGGSSCVGSDGITQAFISGLPDINNIDGYSWGQVDNGNIVMRLTLDQVEGGLTIGQVTLWPVAPVTTTPNSRCETIDFYSIVSSLEFNLQSVGGTLTYDGEYWQGNNQCFTINGIERLSDGVFDKSSGLMGAVNYWETGATISLSPINTDRRVATSEWQSNYQDVTIMLYLSPFNVR